MSPCCGSVCLLVVLGVVVASGNPLQYVSENLKKDHESIADVLKLKETEIGSNPLFSSVIDSIKSQRKQEVLLMNATLDVYTRIFSSILQHNHNQHHESPLLHDLSDAEIKKNAVSALEKLQQKLQEKRNDLKSCLSHLGHLSHNREDVFNKLNKIKVDDPKDQKKALAEFLEIYQAASVIHSKCSHAHSS
ncbi:myosin-9-like [Thunnus thynnus]|uniref:myosin-9-like n=1 Tax=Thunnus thynnus TaxID=8237 RepID=UPI003529C73C|eukprot:superscaffoldBa00003830_g17779